MNCARTRVMIRRVGRHPVIQRTFRSGSLLRKHIVRGATLSIVPSTVNDVVFHHAPLNLGEVVHVVQDTAVLTTMNAVATVLTIATKI